MASSQSQISEGTKDCEHKSRADGDTDTEHQRAKVLKRAQWLRAAILGANDGLLSTTSLMLGIGAASDDARAMVLSGLAGAVAGACSMAIGEYVSVSTQRDIEKAAARSRCSSESDVEVTAAAFSTPASNKSDEVKLEANSLAVSPERPPPIKAIREIKLDEARLSGSSGRSPTMKVLREDAKAKARRLWDEAAAADEKDSEEMPLTNPYQAAAASALAFLCGSAVPLVSAVVVVQETIRIAVIVVTASLALALFGAVGAHLGGSPVTKSAARVLLGGWIAMAISYGLLKPFESYQERHEGKKDAAD